MTDHHHQQQEALAQALASADAAGALVSDHVRSMIQSAHEQSAALVQDAQREQQEIRQRSADALAALLDRLSNAEQRLDTASASVPDARAALEIIRSESAMIRELLGATVNGPVAEPATEASAEPLDEADEPEADEPEADEPAPAPDVDPDPLANVADPLSPSTLSAVEDLAEVADEQSAEESEDPVEPRAAEHADPSPGFEPDASLEERADSPDVQAQERVKASDDEELVDNFEIGLSALADAKRRSDNEEQVAYWQAYVDAIVAEAARRPEFGALVTDPEVPKRRRRKLRKRYEALLAARSERLGQ